MDRLTRRRALAAIALIVSGLVVGTTSVFAQQYKSEVVATGLSNPRGITFGPDGALYVAEVGSGGDGATVTGVANETVSFGTTGAVTRWTSGGGASQVMTGIGSLADATGNGSTGLVDLVWRDGEAYGVIGWVGAGAEREAFALDGGDGTLFGRFARLTTGGVFDAAPTFLADFAAFEQANNPETTDINSNPYSVIATADGFAAIDAGGNTLYALDATGALIADPEIATFAPVANPLFGIIGGPFRQVVPTSVAQDGLSGDFFVGELTGFPFPAGDAHIYRVSEDGSSVNVIPGAGFTTIIDMVFGEDGNLYVLQFSTNGLLGNPGNGQILRVNPTTGDREALDFAGGNPLVTPGGLTFGDDGSLYVTNFGTSGTGGQILRITVVPEPGTGVLIAFASAGLLGASIVRRRRKG